jgi:hypothetical protein
MILSLFGHSILDVKLAVFRFAQKALSKKIYRGERVFK